MLCAINPVLNCKASNCNHGNPGLAGQALDTSQRRRAPLACLLGRRCLESAFESLTGADFSLAEGIEDASTMKRLQTMGCHIAQGYYIGKPGSSNELLTRARPRIPIQDRRVILLAD